jgi:hypothetical protein
MSWTVRPAHLALFVAQTFFLWMFLAAAPIEALADDGALRAPGDGDVAVEAYRFAANWRHGMAGNSPIYMPGFFALAIAAWLWSATKTLGQLVIEGGGLLLVSLAVAWGCANAAEPVILASLERGVGSSAAAPWPTPPWRAVLQGLYTAAAWMTVVVSCRRALAHRSFAPLLVVPPVAVVLALIRPWTVDDFAKLWITRIARGDVVALASAIAIPLVGWILYRTEQRAHRAQTHWRPRRIDADE